MDMTANKQNISSTFMVKITKEAALLYHSQGKPGKIEIVPTKPYRTQTDLSLAYSPGVAEPCLEIQDNPDNAYKYTNKGNLVAVISNGTAVLGLGDIGAVGGKPVMEGKSLLFKIYAGVDAFDIEVDEKDPMPRKWQARRSRTQKSWSTVPERQPYHAPVSTALSALAVRMW